MKNYKLRSSAARIPSASGKMRLIILSPEKTNSPLPGILWIHGGGYAMGMAEMVYASAGRHLAECFGAVVISPNYALKPYPIPLEDCAEALKYMYDHADDLGIDRSRIIVGGESAGGGLTAALCLYARDYMDIPIRMQIPLYPMIDCEDTASSKDNCGRVWNTKRNRAAWKQYLGPLYQTGAVPKYASPARETDYAGLPPCYTFVLDGEPFYEETLAYVRHLQEAGIPASADVYHGNVHAFDMMMPWTKEAKQAREVLCSVCQSYLENKAE